MPLTIIPLPVLHNDELRIDANREAEDGQDGERYTNAQYGRDPSGRVCKIGLDPGGGLSGWQCLQ